MPQPMPPSDKPETDPFLAEEVERAMRPYVGLVPPELLATMREVLEDALKTHPVARGLADHLRERAPVETSGAVPREGADAVVARLPSRGKPGS